MEADDNTPYCLCRQPHSNRFMIGCDHCKDWFHGSCVKIDTNVASEIDRYYCPNCVTDYGPTTFKPLSINRRIDPADDTRVKLGIPALIYRVRQEIQSSFDDLVLRLRGRDLTLQFFEEHGFSRPIMVEKKEGLDLVVPAPSFTVANVEEKIGPMYMIDVIDVEFQEDYKIPMRQWTDYISSPERRERTLNVISLEFSKTALSPLVEPPRIVKEVSWVSSLWPKERYDEMVPEKPEVQKYCLMGVKDSYTDFHIDFGGTSVWYHVLKGEKVFFFVEPTEENLRQFEIWETSSKQNQTFFGDMVDRYWRLVVKQGQTVFIPTAWIHAVYTPVDSLVFGGNFLHSYNVPLQLEAYELERRLQTNEKYQFPSYETVNWFAAKHVFDCLQAACEMKQQPAAYMLSAGDALARHLKKWTQRKDYSKKRDDPAQLEGISYGKLIKELNGILKKFKSGNGKGNKTAKRKGKKSGESKSPVKEKRELETLRLNVGAGEEEKAEEMDVEERTDVYNFQDEEEEEEELTSPANVLKVRIPKRDVQPSPVKKVSPLKLYPSRAEEQKVSPIKLSKLVKDAEGSCKRKRKHKKNRANKRSRTEPASIADEDMEEEEEEDVAENYGYYSSKSKENPKRGLFGMVRKEGEEDSDKDNLVVDETPNAQHANRIKPIQPVTLRLNSESRAEREVTAESSPQPAQSPSQESPQPRPKEAEIIASILKEMVVDKNGHIVHPSQDSSSSRMIAAQSMLTLHQRAPLPLSSPTRPAPADAPVADEEGLLMDDCYQDSEFLYPSFEMDEDQIMGTSSKMQEKDDNWNPKARVNVLNKTEERVPRTGARNQAVASGLAATAKKLAENPSLLSNAERKGPGAKARESRVQPQPGPSNVAVAGPSTASQPGPSSSSATSFSRLIRRQVLDRTPDVVKPKNKKLRKGYKTAKQRIAKKMGLS